MTVSYTKDQGEIYLDRMDYTGNANAGLAIGNRVIFSLDASRTDVPLIYTTNFLVRNAKRLGSILVYAGGQLPPTHRYLRD
jgi:hypothetical protein